jgi:beta-glucosidase
MVNHGMGDENSGALSLNAGMDMDMVGEIFIRYGVELVKLEKFNCARIWPAENT